MDDHALLRHGVRSVLERDGNIQAVGEVESGRKVLATPTVPLG